METITQDCPTCSARLPQHLWTCPELDMAERIAARVAALQAKRRLTKAELAELAQLTYTRPTPRVLPPTDEAPL